MDGVGFKQNFRECFAGVVYFLSPSLMLIGFCVCLPVFSLINDLIIVGACSLSGSFEAL